MKTNTTTMNEHQAKAWRIIKKEAGDIVGGLENGETITKGGNDFRIEKED